jgi:hypothetical protein
MTDREFRDNALIAVSAALAAYSEPVGYAGGTGTRLLPVDEVASRAANIVAKVIEQRKAMEAKK